MDLNAFLLFVLFGFGLCQSMAPICATTLPTGPTLTLQFTPSMPTQTPPTSTVYGAIMTSYLNVVDCKYVMVENVDDNPAQTGSYFYRTTVPVMTVYRVGCMPETTAITRRDFRGYDHIDEVPQTVQPLSDSDIHKRSDLGSSVTNTVLAIAAQLAEGIDPDSDNLTVEAYRYLMQINTALFAINLVNSGLPLNRTCAELRDAEIANQLSSASIYPKQAGDIVCFASRFGIFFNRSNEQLLSDLAALEYAIQVRSGFTSDLRELCETMDLTAAPFLGIDADGIRTLVCTSANITITTTSTLSATTSNTVTGSNETTSSTTNQTSPPPTATGSNMTFFPNTTNSVTSTPTVWNTTTTLNSTLTTSATGTNDTVSGNPTSSLSSVDSTWTWGVTSGTAVSTPANATSTAGPFANTTNPSGSLPITTESTVATGTNAPSTDITTSENANVTTTGTSVGTVGPTHVSVSSESGNPGPFANSTSLSPNLTITSMTETVSATTSPWSSNSTADFTTNFNLSSTDSWSTETPIATVISPGLNNTSESLSTSTSATTPFFYSIWRTSTTSEAKIH